MTSRCRESMKNLTIVITFIIILSFLAGEVCSDPPPRSRCHQVNCPPGYGISGPCFVGEKPPVCKPCTNGTFSSHSSRSAKCRPCRRCDPEREMVLWQCSPTLDTVCVKFRRLDEDGNEFVVRPRILMEKPIDSHVIADIYNKSRQEHAERERKRQELERLRAENMTFDSNVTETLNTDIGVGGHEFSTFSPEMDITTSSRDSVVAKIETISYRKTSQTNDQLFTTPLPEHRYQSVMASKVFFIYLEEGGDTPGQIHRSTALYTAIISTASFLVVIVVLALLIIRRRRARLIMRTCARNERQGCHPYHNTAIVTKLECHQNGRCLVASLDENGEVTTAVIGKNDNPAKNYLPPTTLDTGEDGQFSSCHGSDVSSTRVQDWQTASEITNKSEAAVRATESPLTSNHLHNPDNIYDIIFQGLFDQKGGVLSHEDSDVQLHIPRGAIPSGQKQPIIVKVSLRVSYFNVGLKDEQVPLTPVVECLSPGLDSFLDYVTIKLPHRALLPGKDAKSWRFLVHYNQSMNPRDKSWLKVDQSELSVENNVVVPVKFTVDEKYVNVRTKHFTKFTCSSCGKQRPIFAMDAVAYGKYIPEREQVAVKIYLCDTIKETKVRVAAEERCYSNKSTIGIKPKFADGDWQISCLDNPSEEDWKWQINETEGLLPRTQVKTMNEIVSCCSESLPPYAEFLFEPKLTSECGPPNYFKVYFSLQQSLSGEMTVQEKKILSLDLSVNKVPTPGELEQGNFDPQHNLGLPRDTRCDPSGLQKVCKELDLFQARSLVRTLLPNDNCESALENIEHNNHDTREKKYQFLIHWLKVVGIRATYEVLYNALIKEEIRKAAEVVAEIWRFEAGRKKPKITQV